MQYDDSLNIKREQIIMKIYLTQTDIRNFMHCGWDKAIVLFNKAWDMCVRDGKINVEGKIYYKYLLDIVKISEAEIHRMAKIERQIKKDAASCEETHLSRRTLW